MSLLSPSLPWIPRKFARQQKVALPVGRSGRQVRIPVKWILAVVIGLFCLAGLGLVVHAKVFTLQQVVVVELVRAEPSVIPVTELQAEANKLQQRSLLLINSEQMADAWMQQFPSLGKLEISKDYPHTLVVGYLPRIAMAQLITPQGDYLVDRQGFIFAQARSERLPTLTTDITSVGVGQTISADGVRLGLDLVEGLRGQSPRLVSLVLHDRQLDIQLAGPPLIFVGQHQSSAEVLSELSVLMSRFELEQRYPRELDFRYNRPVIRY